MTPPKREEPQLNRTPLAMDAEINLHARAIEELRRSDASHATKDEGQFGELKAMVVSVEKNLSQRFDKGFAALQRQIDEITKQRVFAEGKAAGMADAADALERRQRPNPWLLAIAPAIATLLLGAILSWGVRDHIQGGIGSGSATTTTTSTTGPEHTGR